MRIKLYICCISLALFLYFNIKKFIKRIEIFVNMQLEEALSIIDEVDSNKHLAMLAPISVDCKKHIAELVDPLFDLVCTQKKFYSELERMTKWAYMQPPDPKGYGKDAEKWAKYVKVERYGKWGYGISSALLVLSTVVYEAVTGTAPPMPFICLAGVMAGTFITSAYTANKAGSLKVNKDVGRYIKDSAEFYALCEIFTAKGDIVGNSLFLYQSALERFCWVLRKQGYHETQLGILNTESDKLSFFKERYKDLIKSIARSKKENIPPNARGIAANKRVAFEIISQTIAMLLDYVQKESDIDSQRLDLVKEYIKGPQLVLIKN